MAISTIIIISYVVALVLCHIANGYPSIKESNMFDFDVKPLITNNLIPTPTTNAASTKLLNDELATASGIITPKPPIIELNDIFISVKTTKANHATRLDVISKTWFQLAPKQTWFFTDADDAFYEKRLNNHLINTKCAMGHSRRALCCKMAAELNAFLEHRKKWFCHFDDDNYVNVPQLVQFLNEYNPTMSWYLGKPSVASPLEIHLENKQHQSNENKIKFWFATGGAGFCISRPLALQMAPLTRGNKLTTISDQIRFPDDVTVGFIIEYMLKVPLTVVDQFHSHFEQMIQILPQTFQHQISFSYAQNNDTWNVVKVNGFDKQIDPTRFHSLHCHLFPYLHSCSAVKY